MPLLDELKKSRATFVACHSCSEEFPLCRAGLFDATKPILPKAIPYLAEQQQALTKA